MAFLYESTQATLTFGPHALTLRWAASVTRGVGETGPLPFGCGVWPSALVLGDALVAHAGRLRGVTALELGCGVGVCAVLAARLGARVTATDFHPDMRAFVEDNARANGADVTFEVLDWTANAALQVQPHPVVMGSDLLYDPAGVTPCVDVLERALAPGGLALLADPGRKALWRLKDKLLARGFVVHHSSVMPQQLAVGGREAVLAAHPNATGPAHLLSITRT